MSDESKTEIKTVVMNFRCTEAERNLILGRSIMLYGDRGLSRYIRNAAVFWQGGNGGVELTRIPEEGGEE